MEGTLRNQIGPYKIAEERLLTRCDLFMHEASHSIPPTDCSCRADDSTPTLISAVHESPPFDLTLSCPRAAADAPCQN